jgi:2-polyprenyl-3-methyl-5-hydroxy-6-metoxy-1,4-benzoquinol methylase
MEFTKKMQYYNHIRTELIEMLTSVKGRFLEIGCGTGATLEYLKSKGASYVVGIDVNKEAVDVASKRGLDLVLSLNVEKDDFPFSKKEFDCIILTDVLEHLYNPWETLKKITPYLKDDGYVLLSIPNIKNYQVLRRLVFYDEWSYGEEGILDNTHIRFFTLKEIKKLLDFAGLKILKLNYGISSGRKFKFLNALIFNKLHSFSVVQYYVLAEKK